MQVGPYTLEEEIGRGGMGSVWRAQGPAGPVAIKFLTRAAPENLARFEREARLMRELEPHGFVAILDLGSSPRGAYLVMPLVAGGTLRDRLYRGPLPAEEVRNLGIRLARMLGAAHARQVVHRDLKPDNVLFTSEGQPVLADLGIAKHFGSGAEESVVLSQTGQVRGTVGYMAPEQIRNAKSADGRADVFALGVVLYECLLGSPPFGEEGVLEVMARVASGTFEPLPAQLGPASLRAAIHRALQPAPEERFQDGEAFARALEAPGLAAGPSARIGLALGALLVLCTLLGGAVSLRGSPSASLSPTPTRVPQVRIAGPRVARHLQVGARGKLIELERVLGDRRGAVPRGGTVASSFLEKEGRAWLLTLGRGAGLQEPPLAAWTLPGGERIPISWNGYDPPATGGSRAIWATKDRSELVVLEAGTWTQRVLPFARTTNVPIALGISPSGKLALSATSGRAFWIDLWDLKEGSSTSLRVPFGVDFSRQTSSMRIGFIGETAAFCFLRDGRLWVWSDLKAEPKSIPHRRVTRALQASAAAAGRDGLVVPTGRKAEVALLRLDGTSSRVFSSPKGASYVKACAATAKQALVLYDTGEAHLFDLAQQSEGPSEKWTQPLLGSSYGTAGLTADGRYAATSFHRASVVSIKDGCARLWGGTHALSRIETLHWAESGLLARGAAELALWTQLENSQGDLPRADKTFRVHGTLLIPGGLQRHHQKTLPIATVTVEAGALKEVRHEGRPAGLVSFDPTGERFAIVGGRTDLSVRIVNARKAEEEGRFYLAEAAGPPRSIRWDPLGQHLWIAGRYGSRLYPWRVGEPAFAPARDGTRERLQRLIPLEGTKRALVSDGSAVWLSEPSGTLQIGPDDRLIGCDVERKLLIYLSDQGEVSLGDLAGNRLDRLQLGDTRGPACVAFDPKGGRFAIGTSMGEVLVLRYTQPAAKAPR